MDKFLRQMTEIFISFVTQKEDFTAMIETKLHYFIWGNKSDLRVIYPWK